MRPRPTRLPAHPPFAAFPFPSIVAMRFRCLPLFVTCTTCSIGLFGGCGSVTPGPLLPFSLNHRLPALWFLVFVVLVPSRCGSAFSACTVTCLQRLRWVRSLLGLRSLPRALNAFLWPTIPSDSRLFLLFLVTPLSLPAVPAGVAPLVVCFAVVIPTPLRSWVPHTASSLPSYCVRPSLPTCLLLRCPFPCPLSGPHFFPLASPVFFLVLLPPLALPAVLPLDPHSASLVRCCRCQRLPLSPLQSAPPQRVYASEHLPFLSGCLVPSLTTRCPCSSPSPFQSPHPFPVAAVFRCSCTSNVPLCHSPVGVLLLVCCTRCVCLPFLRPPPFSYVAPLNAAFGTPSSESPLPF